LQKHFNTNAHPNLDLDSSLFEKIPATASARQATDKMIRKKTAISLTLLTFLALLSLALFSGRVADCFKYPELQNTTDMEIFSGAAKNYLRSGELYLRSDDYKKTYAPGEGVYKFPPPYQLTILPLLKIYPDNFDFLFVQRVIQLSLYLFASILLMASIGKVFIWHDKPISHQNHRYRAVQFILLSFIVIFWSMGFFESFSGIEPEILIFSILAIAFYFLIKNPFLSGALIAIAAALKIYPALMVLYFIFKLNIKALLGVATGFLFITVISIYYLGLNEHVFYITKLLPVLLQEKPIYHIQNTTIEALIHAHNLIPGMNGSITTVTKLLTISTIVVIGILTRRESRKESLLFYSMLVSGLLLCLSNYWPQYLIVLIIPMLCLLAYAISSKSNILYFIMIILAVAMGAEEMWFGELINAITAYETPMHLEPVAQFIQQHPSLDPIFYFYPLLWILKRIKDLVFLLPMIFFLISAWLLLTNQLNKNASISFNDKMRPETEIIKNIKKGQQ
jgi:hypothetical protein